MLMDHLHMIHGELDNGLFVAFLGAYLKVCYKDRMIESYDHIKKVAIGWSFILPSANDSLVSPEKVTNTCSTDTFLMMMVFLTAQGRLSTELMKAEKSVVFDCVLKILENHTTEARILLYNNLPKDNFRKFSTKSLECSFETNLHASGYLFKLPEMWDYESCCYGCGYPGRKNKHIHRVTLLRNANEWKDLQKTINELYSHGRTADCPGPSKGSKCHKEGVVKKQFTMMHPNDVSWPPLLVITKMINSSDTGLKSLADIPRHLDVHSQRYELGAVVFYGGFHFTLVVTDTSIDGDTNIFYDGRGHSNGPSDSWGAKVKVCPRSEKFENMHSCDSFDVTALVFVRINDNFRPVYPKLQKIISILRSRNKLNERDGWLSSASIDNECMTSTDKQASPIGDEDNGNLKDDDVRDPPASPISSTASCLLDNTPSTSDVMKD